MLKHLLELTEEENVRNSMGAEMDLRTERGRGRSFSGLSFFQVPRIAVKIQMPQVSLVQPHSRP